MSIFTSGQLRQIPKSPKKGVKELKKGHFQASNRLQANGYMREQL